MKSPVGRVLLLIILFAVIAIGGSLLVLARRQPAEVWTPAPVTRATGQPTRVGAILPSPTDSGRQVNPAATPTAVRLPQPTPTRAPATAVPTRPPPTATETSKLTATPDPHQFIITEADIQRAVASGATAQSGLVSEGLAVRFTGGKMRITADKLAYGPAQVQNLDLVGRLVAQNGQLQLETESVSPRNLVTALLPTLANQALAQFTAQWYVEEVRTLEGRLEVRIR